MRTSSTSEKKVISDRELATESAIELGGPSRRRGFAAMPSEVQRQIASLGGRVAHERGLAHEFTSEEGRIAGAKGGAAVSSDRTHMARIGRLGGQRRGQRNRER